ncbi:MAG: NAD-dependent epimerase/dehydratase family protein [Bacteroidota bacterium]
MSLCILITGGCGFVGSSLAIGLKALHPSYHIICFDNLKRRGSELNLPRLAASEIEFVHGDIRNKEDLVFSRQIDIIIDAAAEPSVMAGLHNATDYLINTNFNGTVNSLNLALAHKAKFIFLSTSRVYPIEALEQIKFVEKATRFDIAPAQGIAGLSIEGISEAFSLNGYRSLYGSTKLASELIVQEYNKLLSVPAIIDRCGVITGPNQMGKVDQGVFVLWVARHYWQKKLGYFGFGGTGKQVRDMMHVADLLQLVDQQIHNFDTFDGGIFNAGGGRDKSVSLQELTRICEEVTGNKIEINSVPENRPADIRLYITDNQKIHSISGWQAKKSVKDTVSDIFEWIRANEQTLKPIIG